MRSVPNYHHYHYHYHYHYYMSHVTIIHQWAILTINNININIWHIAYAICNMKYYLLNSNKYLGTHITSCQ